MDSLNELLNGNAQWAERIQTEDADFFHNLAKHQKPEVFLVGCSDSRVPVNQIVNARPGEIFVHRNIANLIKPSDANAMSALHYAVESLHVRHIIICGHTNCGGVKAAWQQEAQGAVDEWIEDIKIMISNHNEWVSEVPPDRQLDCWCELNVIDQVRKVAEVPVVQKRWDAGEELQVHGWVLALENGRLHLAQKPLPGNPSARHAYEEAIEQLQRRFL